MPAKTSELQKALNDVLGKDVIRMGSDSGFVVEYLPTGVLPIDYLLGGGVPKGRFIEIFGNFSVLKSYIGLKCIAMTQRNGGTCALVDTEHAFDPEWAAFLGVDVDNLMLSWPKTGELAVDATEGLIRQGVDLIVWDSVAATLPKAEQQKSSQDNDQPARLASLMSAATRKLTAANTKTAILCINQTRVNVGVMFGSTEAVPGGKALGFYASQRVALRKGGQVKETVKAWDGESMKDVKQTVAYKIRAVLEKSKLNKPHREVWMTFDLATGAVDDVGFLIGLGMEHGLIQRKGKTHWKFKGGKKWISGREKFKAWVADDEKRVRWLERKIREAESE